MIIIQSPKIYCILLLFLSACLDVATSQESLSTSSVTTNETERTFQVFSITLGDESEDEGGLSLGFGQTPSTKHIIFHEGRVESHWEPRTDWSETQFYHGAYADRISFDFYFGTSPNYNYTLKKPEVRSSVPGVAQPAVIDFQTDEDENSGSMTIVYDCKKSNDIKEKNTTVLVTFDIFGGVSVKFGFRKTCQGGIHKYLDFGYYTFGKNRDDTVRRDGSNNMQRMTFPQPNFIVGPHESSTRIFLLLQKPAETQEFFHVIASSLKADGKVDNNNEGLAVRVQGPVFGGVLRKGHATILYVVYECKRDGKHQVQLKIPLRPFDDLTATWHKDCGGGVADGLRIGTEPGHEDVVKNGLTRETWLLGVSATSDRIGKNAPIINSTTRVRDFWISNAGTTTLQIASEVVTIEKPDIVSIRVTRDGENMMNSGIGMGLGTSMGMGMGMGFGLTGGNNDNNFRNGMIEEGELLPSAGTLRLRLRLLCKKKGRSLILLTLPIKSFQRIDLGFVKECRAPRQFRHSGFLRTADSWMMMTLCLLMLSGICICWRLLSVPDKSQKHQSPDEGHTLGGYRTPITPKGRNVGGMLGIAGTRRVGGRGNEIMGLKVGYKEDRVV